MILATIAGLMLAFAAPSSAVSAEPVGQIAPETLVIERTYLKAKAGERENLARFIVANWFAMDAIAKQQGLFTHYRLAENQAPDADWDMEVAVGYPNADGFANADVQARFAAIRKQHKTILIDGKGLAELGQIVRSDRIRPREKG